MALLFVKYLDLSRCNQLPSKVGGRAGAARDGSIDVCSPRRSSVDRLKGASRHQLGAGGQRKGTRRVRSHQPPFTGAKSTPEVPERFYVPSSTRPEKARGLRGALAE